MAVNYEDERFQQVTQEQDQAIKNVQDTYNNMINQSRDIYQQQANEVERYGKEQAQLQQANTDFTIQKIEQQKDRAQQDYTKQQKGAYADYQEQINPYGATAEALAHIGLRGSGYTETSIRSMYNQYQNRVATANESYQRAVQDYDNDINQARLTNNAKLAEIAYNALQQKLSINLEGFQYQNKLMQEQLNALNEEKDRYYNRWKDVLSQINYENEVAEQKRQFDEQMALQRRAQAFNESQAFNNNDLEDYLLARNNSIEDELNTNANGQLASEPVKVYNGETYIPVDGAYADNGSPIYRKGNGLYYWDGTKMVFGGNSSSGSTNNAVKTFEISANENYKSNTSPAPKKTNKKTTTTKKKESEFKTYAKTRVTGKKNSKNTKQRLSK